MRFPSLAKRFLIFVGTFVTLATVGEAAPPVHSLGFVRRAAVRRGTDYLLGFFQEEAHETTLGADAVSIFLELGETTRDPVVHRKAMAEARRLALRLETRYLAPGALEARGTLHDALWLLAETRLLHLPEAPLLRAIQQRLASFDADAAYFGGNPSHLEALDEDAVYDLLIATYAVERARLVHPELPQPRFGLAQLLPYLFARNYVGFDADDPKTPLASDHFYLATHVAYVLSDYSRLRLAPADLGPLLPWLKAQLPHALNAKDFDAAAELVDLFRGLGRGDQDPEVRAGTRLLLESQRPDGSWLDAASAAEDDAYDQVHPTWVAVQALRDRRFLKGTPWAKYVHRLLGARHPRYPEIEKRALARSSKMFRLSHSARLRRNRRLWPRLWMENSNATAG